MLATFGKAYVKTNQRKLSFGRHRIDYPIDPHGTSRTLDGKENNQVRKWNQYLNLSEVCSQVKFAPDKNSATKEIAIQQSWTPADQ